MLVTTEDDTDEQHQEAAGRWDAFWGYDLVQSKGLLEKVFTKLQIKESSWPSLKEIPEVRADSSSKETSSRPYIASHW